MFKAGDKVCLPNGPDICTVIQVHVSSSPYGTPICWIDAVRDSDGIMFVSIPANQVTLVGVTVGQGMFTAYGPLGGIAGPKPLGITSGAVLAMQETTEIKIGDTVEYYGSNAKVLSAHYDFGNGEMRYKIELLDGDKTQYNTSANYLKVVASSADKVSTGANGCECGCWAVPGFENNHSYWCPKYRKAN